MKKKFTHKDDVQPGDVWPDELWSKTKLSMTREGYITVVYKYVLTGMFFDVFLLNNRSFCDRDTSQLMRRVRQSFDRNTTESLV